MQIRVILVVLFLFIGAANAQTATLAEARRWRDAGDFDKAKIQYENALANWERSGAAISKTDFVNKSAAFAELIEILQRQGDARGETLVLLRSGEWMNALLGAAKRHRLSKGVALAIVFDPKSRGAEDLAVIAAANFNRAGELADELEDRELAARALLGLATTHLYNNEPRRGFPLLAAALKVWRELERPNEIAETLVILAASHDENNDYAAAVRVFGEAIVLLETLNQPEKLAHAVNGSALALENSNRLSDALTNYRRAAALFAAANNPNGELVAQINAGKILQTLGDAKTAQTNFEKALILARKSKNSFAESEALKLLGTAEKLRGNAGKAFLHWQAALQIARRLSDERQIGALSYLLAASQTGKNQSNAALKLFETGLEISRRNSDLPAEAANLQGVALIHFQQKDYLKAAENLRLALSVTRQTGSQIAEANVLANLMTAHRDAKQTTLAVFYGKQAINLLQTTRREIKTLDQNLQDSFLLDKTAVYRVLADVLIADGRLNEAQNVLAMLKDEETGEFVTRDAVEMSKLATRADLNDAERAALVKYNKFAGNLTALGTEFAALDAKRKKLPDGAQFSEKARYDELNAQIKAANEAFLIFLNRELIAEIGEKAQTTIEQDRALQGKLQKWGAGTVALATVAGADRYRVILTTPTTQIDGKTEITAANLNRKIAEFRVALRNPNVDPRPLGKELYDILIKPVETHLKGANAKTLVWTLDGTLRYIPLAALWDGEQYLVQKYQNVIVTATTRQSLNAEIKNDWRALGAGVSGASSIKIGAADNAETITFERLPSVSQELNLIANQTGAESGVFAGKRMIDAEFTVAALKNSLGKTDEQDRLRYNVVHFATHFHLGSTLDNSFLLLGGNQFLSLKEVAVSPELDFTDVELVTLSACNTAFAGGAMMSNENGKEVDSLAKFIENRGAKAILATLWSVADDSTQTLIAEFYRLKKAEPNLSKAAAMQRAQTALLDGTIKTTATSGAAKTRGSLTLGGRGDKKFPYDAAKPFAHPYFWSPFVLIGNWR